MNIKIIVLAVSLSALVPVDSSAYESVKGPYQVGFNSYKVYDYSRSYFVGYDSISRPLLIHFWYPSKQGDKAQVLNFKHYMDLIAQREDFGTSKSEIDNVSFNYVKGYADYAKRHYALDSSLTALQILDSKIAVKSGLPIHFNDTTFPLLIYAPSNGKVSVQNHLICEYLASHGFMILSVASAGMNSIDRKNMEESTLAQVIDLEYILDYAVDSLQIQYSNLGLFGFSSGGNAIALFQMRNKHVKAVFSMDGSQEFSYYMKLYKMEDFNLEKANVPYCSLVNNYKNYSSYPFYHSIVSSEKYLYRMPHLNHYGFIAYWRFFETVSFASKISDFSLSYDYISLCALGFFTKYLKSGSSLFDAKLPVGSENEYIQPISQSFASINTLCNALLDNNLDLAAKEMEENMNELFAGENQVNLLARMVTDKDMAIWLYQKSLLYHPDSWETHYGLGLTYKEKGEKIHAMDALLKAQKLNPDNTKITDQLIELRKME